MDPRYIKQNLAGHGFVCMTPVTKNQVNQSSNDKEKNWRDDPHWTTWICGVNNVCDNEVTDLALCKRFAVYRQTST